MNGTVLATTPRPRRVDVRRRRALVLGVVTAIVALPVLLWHIDRPAAWTDETATTNAVRRSWFGLAHLLFGQDAPLVPYYALEKAYYDIASVFTSAHPWFVCRWSSAVFAAVCVGFSAWWAARRSVTLALSVAAILVAFGGFDRYAQEARPYALMMLAATWSWYSWWQALRETPTAGADGAKPSGTAYRRYSVSIVALCLVHAFAVVQVVGQAAVTLWAVRRGDPRARPTLRALLRGAVCALPWLAWAAIFGTGPASRHVPFSIDQVWIAATQMVGSPHGTDIAALLVIALGVLAAAVALRRPDWKLLTGCALAWAVSAPIVLVLARPVLSVALQSRYWLSSLPGCGLVAALGARHLAMWIAQGVPGRWARTRTPVRAVVAAAVVVALAAANWGAQHQIRRNDGHGEDSRPAVALASGARWSTAPILVDSSSGALVISEIGPQLQHRIVGWDHLTSGRNVFATQWPDARLAEALRTQREALFFVRTKRVYRQHQSTAYLGRLLDVYLPHAVRADHLTHGTVLYQGGSWVLYLLR